jgi:hypothetical protein
MSRLPFVAVGFELCRLRTPFIVKSLLAVTPPAPLIVKLLTLPVKIDAGNVIAEVFAKAKVAEALLASTNPLLVLVGELPAIVNVLPARLRVPDVKPNNPFTIKS